MKPFYFKWLQRRAWIIVLVIVLAVGGTIVHITSQAPRYQAQASILVLSQLMPSMFDATGLSTMRNAYRETQLNDVMQLLKSRTVLERAVSQVQGLTPDDLDRQMSVRTIGGTDFLIVGAISKQPARAALIVNATTQALASFYAQIGRTEATNTRRYIEQQLSLAQGRLNVTEQALVEFQTQSGAEPLPENVSSIGQRLFDLKAEYDTAMLDESTAEARVAAIRSHLASQNDLQLALISIATNPVVSQIRDHLTGLELDLASLRQRYTDEYPKVQVLKGEIADDQKRLKAEAAKVLASTSEGVSPIRDQFVREMIGAEVDAASARVRAVAIGSLLSKLQADPSAVPTRELTLMRLQRAEKAAERRVTDLSILRQQALIRENQADSSAQMAIVVVDPAIAPDTPLPTRIPEMVLLAGLLALGIGAALAVAVDLVAERVRPMSLPEWVSVVPALAAVIVVFVGLTVGVVADVYGVQVDPPRHGVYDLSQALAYASHALQSVFAALVAAVLANANRISQGFVHVLRVRGLLSGHLIHVLTQAFQNNHPFGSVADLFLNAIQ